MWQLSTGSRHFIPSFNSPIVHSIVNQPSLHPSSSTRSFIPFYVVSCNDNSIRIVNATNSKTLRKFCSISYSGDRIYSLYRPLSCPSPIQYNLKENQVVFEGPIAGTLSFFRLNSTAPSSVATEEIASLNSTPTSTAPSSVMDYQLSLEVIRNPVLPETMSSLPSAFIQHFCFPPTRGEYLVTVDVHHFRDVEDSSLEPSEYSAANSSAPTGLSSSSSSSTHPMSPKAGANMGNESHPRTPDSRRGASFPLGFDDDDYYCAYSNQHSIETSLKFWIFRRSSNKYSLNTLIDCPHGNDLVTSIAYHPFEDIVLTTSDVGEFKIWSLTERLTSKAFSSASAQKTTPFSADKYLWTCHSSGSYLDERCNAATFSSDGSVFAVAYGGLVTVWELKSLSLKTTLTFPLQHEKIREMQFLTNSPYIVGTTNTRLVVWNLLNCEIVWIHTFPCIKKLTVDPKSTRFAISATKAFKPNHVAHPSRQSLSSEYLLSFCYKFFLYPTTHFCSFLSS